MSWVWRQKPSYALATLDRNANSENNAFYTVDCENYHAFTEYSWFDDICFLWHNKQAYSMYDVESINEPVICICGNIQGTKTN